MTKIDDGGPAFPTSVAIAPSGDVHHGFYGMSLRDWFAGQAPVSFQDAKLACGWPETFVPMTDAERDTVTAVLALMRYEYADAMLAERAKDKSG